MLFCEAGFGVFLLASGIWKKAFVGGRLAFVGLNGLCRLQAVLLDACVFKQFCRFMQAGCRFDNLCF